MTNNTSDMDLFNMYVQQYLPDFVKFNETHLCFCSNKSCFDCSLENICFERGNVPLINFDEYMNIKFKTPEWCI